MSTGDIVLRKVSKIFGPTPARLLDELRAGISKEALLAQTGHTIGVRDVSLTIEAGKCFVVMGLSGSGKSTLLRHLNRLIDPTSGDRVDISPEFKLRGPRTIELDRDGMRELEALHARIDAHDGWHLEQRVETIITELHLPAAKKMNELSGGWRRRVALARALVQKPDLLLLDEPTNHLDIATIKWLEDRGYAYPGAVLFITHDRAFLDRLATRIIEIDRGKLTSWPGNYNNYLIRKEKSLEDEATAEARFDKKLEQEEAWIRQGIKARRTRNEGRVRSLEKMRAEREERLSKEGKARIHIEEAEQSGRKVIRARNVNFSYGDEHIVRDFSIRIMRGDRIGLIGNNGVGKTTLLRLLLGELEPQSGTVKLGTNLEVGYFDQLRQALDLEKSVAYNVGEGRTYINLNGKDRHIVGYLRGFLFSPKRAVTPVKALSGGERNRVILAKLFTRPANLLVLDEPTNDLDIETLEVLEQKLCEFNGTLIVVSHDREFLDNVVTSTIVFEEDGKVQEYVGGYSDWLRHGHRLAVTDDPEQEERHKQVAADRRKRRSATKLSYKDQRELDGLPAEIESLEAAVSELQAAIADPDFFAGESDDVQAKLAELRAAESLLETRIERWGELETLRESYLQ